ncbi:hypothetical protein AB0J63_17735 [Streptosporangium canum]|uniref:hypothetical protein n=1 Tax=Streptosporangium canum TaxID=324952 RepID=UPI00344AEAE4
MTTTDAIYEHLTALRAALPDLDEALIPGTPRRWSERDLTPEQRARQDKLAVAERDAKAANLARGIKTLGDGKAPLNLAVLDAAADITAGVAELEDAVCERLGITPLVGATTAERISRIIGLLDRVALHEDLAEHVHTEASRLRRAASRALGDSEPIVKLKARCTICRSLSLRAFPERAVVACVDETCRCDNEDCPCGWERPQRHTWPFDTWPWLADHLEEGIGVAS